MEKMSRRKALGAMVGAATIGGACVAGLNLAMHGVAEAASSAFPWTYHKLDPKAAAEAAYWGFYNEGKGCCYGVFAAIVEPLSKKYGAPYSTFPLDMMTIGKSGIAGWGSICGALLGASAAIGLFHNKKEHVPYVDELFRWYEATSLPMYTPIKAKLGGTCKPTVAGSILCHVSASKWCFETKSATHSPERSERCGRLTGDVAMKTVEILNAVYDKTFAFSGFSDELKHCQTCHSKDEAADYAKGKMNCTPCHSDLGENHPN